MFSCTLTTGIQVMVVAQAAAETGDDTPYWRTLKMGGGLNEKYPGGVEGHRRRLESEGHHVERKGRKWRLAGFEDRLVPNP